MKTMTKIIALICALCVMLGGVAAAEECGIGEAVSYVPAETQGQQVHPAANTQAPVAGNADESGTRGFVTRMYRVVLGREPDPVGLEKWVAQLESGKFGAADLVLQFFNSIEYAGKKKTSAEIVTDCYNAMLGRDPDESGFENWKMRLDVGMTWDAVCRGFIGSREFLNLAASYNIRPGTIVLRNARDQNYERTAFVYRLYRDCLNRTPDVAGLENWCRSLGMGMDGTNVAKGFIFSREYKNTLPSNEAYVEMLYHTILGRNPDGAGKNSWMRKLDYTDTRERVLNQFMFSPEFAKKCAAAGINVGKAIYEPDKSAEWQANIQILALVNEERAKVGLDPLNTREDLWERVAMVRAREIKQLFDKDHHRPDYSPWYTAYTDAGFPDSGMAENIAFGFRTAKSVMNAWMNSTGHRNNILTAGLTTLATGLFSKSYWSQDFYAER